MSCLAKTSGFLLGREQLRYVPQRLQASGNLMALLYLSTAVPAHAKDIACSDIRQPSARSLIAASSGESDLDERPSAHKCALALLRPITCRHGLPSASTQEPGKGLTSKQVLLQGPVM